jgi:AraC family transcriptional regulator
MSLPASPAKTIDYHQANAADAFLPNPAILASTHWHNLHLELHHQPEFEIGEHQHTMHVLACGLPVVCPETGTQALATGERWLDGKRHCERRQAGNIAIIPMGISHRCNWHTTAKFGILAIEPSLLQQVGQDWVNPNRIELRPRLMNEPDPLIQGIFLSLESELTTGGIGGGLLVDSLQTTLALHLLRHYCTTSPQPIRETGGLSSSTLALVTDYIAAHLHQELTLAQLSTIGQISPYHFLRLFKQSVGKTPHQYILQRRLELAKRLLALSDLGLADIATQTGFCDQSHLNRCFKRSFGQTMMQFRRQGRPN